MFVGQLHTVDLGLEYAQGRIAASKKDVALLSVLGWRSDKLNIDVPVGFITDYSSIPWIAAPLLWMYDTDAEGALHDYLYALQIPRSLADRIYYDALVANGKPKFVAYTMYKVLRCSGWYAYWRCRRGLSQSDFYLPVMKDEDILKVFKHGNTSTF